MAQGLGTILKGKISASLTALASVLQVDGLDVSIGQREITNLLSAARAYAPTLPDAGELTFTIFYDQTNSTHSWLAGLATTPAIVNWEVDWTDGHSEAFSGFVTGLKYTGMTIEGTLQAELKIKATGVPTIG